MSSVGDPSPRSGATEEVVTGANTPMLRRCRSTSTTEIRFVFEQFRVAKASTSRATRRNSWTSRSEPNCGNSPQRSTHVLSFEDHVRLHLSQNRQQQRPARDHQITHSGATVPQVPAADELLEMLQPAPCGRSLRE